KPRKIRGGGAMTPAMPRESPASEAVRSDEVSAGARARIRRIANRTPKTAVLIASISAGSPSHMICLTLKANQFSHRPPVTSSFGSADRLFVNEHCPFVLTYG